MNKTKQRIKELEEERDRLRKITDSHSVSRWKFWQLEKDKELLRAYERLIDLNNKRRATKQTLKEVEEVIDKEINWYKSYEVDGEKDEEILMQSRAILSKLEELKKELGLKEK